MEQLSKFYDIEVSFDLSKIKKIKQNTSCNNWASTRENLTLEFENNKCTDQPAYPRSLISAFVNRVLESIVCRLVMSEISIFKLVSVAVEPGLSLALPDNPKIGFVASIDIFDRALNG